VTDSLWKRKAMCRYYYFLFFIIINGREKSLRLQSL